MTDPLDSRRRFLQGVLATAALAALPAGLPAHAADPPQLAEHDPTAKAMGYVASAGKLDPAKEPTFKKGSTCGNCALYQAAQDKGGFAPCAAFPGKVVSKAGWCRAWAAKPA